ncbi:MAG: PAS domain-containing protein, partial [Pirellulaceae bacterium]
MTRARSRENALGKLLDVSPRAVYVVDEQRQIIYCNRACGELLGVACDQLVGQRCVYQVAPNGSTLPNIAASLCPPPEVFAGQFVSAAVAAIHVSGSLLTRHATFIPLGAGALDNVGTVVVLSLSDARDS